VSYTGPTGDGARAVAAPRSLAGAAKRAQWRVFDGGFVVIRQCQLDQAVEVLEHFWIPLHRGLPILVDTTLQLRLRCRNLGWVRRGMVVMVGMGRDPFQVCRVRRLAALRQQPEVL
jgi:hypothetical protein